MAPQITKRTDIALRDALEGLIGTRLELLRELLSPLWNLAAHRILGGDNVLIDGVTRQNPASETPSEGQWLPW